MRSADKATEGRAIWTFERDRNMLGTHTDEIRLVQESLRGRRPVDEAALAAVEVLGERLERLKQSSSLFAGVVFSEHVERMAGRGVFAAAG